MKNNLPIITALLILSWGVSSPVSAQMVYPAGGTFVPIPTNQIRSATPTTTVGMFGPRTVGGPSYPVATSGMFGPRVVGGQSFGAASTGMFGTRFVGPPMNSYNLGIQNGTVVALPYASPANSATLSALYPETPATVVENDMNNMNNAGVMEEMPPITEAAPQPLPLPAPANGTGTPASTPTQQGPAAAPAVPTAQSPAAMNSPYPRGWAFAGTSLPGSAPAYVRSATLSDRLTQIARDRGMLAGQRIEVSLYGDIALVQGTVLTSGDRTVLANVLSLEPRVQRIDNRLKTEENNASLGNLKNR
jgi:hypothetical protein